MICTHPQLVYIRPNILWEPNMWTLLESKRNRGKPYIGDKTVAVNKLSVGVCRRWQL